MKTQAMLCIVTITGLWTLSSCLTHQYHFVYDKMNWTDAQQYCRDKFTDLATIHTLEDVNTLNRMVDLRLTRVWIGLYNDVKDWRWSLADERFYNDSEEHKFTKWARGEPDGQLCVQYANGLWIDSNCATRGHSICFNDTDQMKNYIIIPKAQTWYEAQRECRKKHTDLASVRSQAENQEIQKITWSQGKYWIGLYRHSWKWSDGSSSSFRHWNDGKPNGDLTDKCAALSFPRESKWGDTACYEKRAFICYSFVVKKQVLRVKLTINSFLDMNGPAIPDTILEQLKQNMKDHQGVPADIKVRWVKQADGRIFHKENKKKREKKKRERRPVLTKREL